MRFLMIAVLLWTSSSAAAAEITRETVLRGINAYRQQHQLPPLRENERLNDAAEDRMQDMEELGYFAHVSPDGRSPFLWMSQRGYPFTSAAENLAAGFETAEVLVQAWMDSPGHRRNILGSSYEECGIAIIEGSTTGRATGHSIVVMFAGRSQPVTVTAAR